jgi:signal peptidase II
MIYLIIAAFIVLCDQLSKYYLTELTASGGSMSVIPGFIRFIYTENTGAAFSFMKDSRWLLVAISGAVIVVIAVILLRYSSKIGKPASFALALVMGGAMSNLIDRALFGYVADFFDFEFMRFAVFNVADIFITVGGLAFCLFYILNPAHDGKSGEKKRRSVKAAASADITDDTPAEDDLSEGENDDAADSD